MDTHLVSFSAVADVLSVFVFFPLSFTYAYFTPRTLALKEIAHGGPAL